MLTEIYIINNAFYLWLKLKHLYFCRYVQFKNGNSVGEQLKNANDS